MFQKSSTITGILLIITFEIRVRTGVVFKPSGFLTYSDPISQVFKRGQMMGNPFPIVIDVNHSSGRGIQNDFLFILFRV